MLRGAAGARQGAEGEERLRGFLISSCKYNARFLCPGLASLFPSALPLLSLSSLTISPPPFPPPPPSAFALPFIITPTVTPPHPSPTIFVLSSSLAHHLSLSCYRRSFHPPSRLLPLFSTFLSSISVTACPVLTPHRLSFFRPSPRPPPPCLYPPSRHSLPSFLP